MRRKYDMRNKKSFLIIIILAILVVGVFSLFIYRYNKASKIEYILQEGVVIQDTEKNYIKLDAEGKLKIRWSGNYYLIYQDKTINLGKRVITYNELTGEMKLYGDYYEIQEDGKIIKNSNETVLSNTTNTKFYKMADREYLLVDREIKSSDNNTQASGYLLVELDKLGNAKLSNNKINLKTITPTTLVTSKYRFDINNEILNFGNYDIDLKKIIGSSNQYKPEETNGGNGGSGGGGGGGGSGNGSGTGNGTGDGTGTGGNGTGTLGNGNGGNGGVINNRPGGEDTDIDDIKDKTKMTSVVRVSEGMTQIDIDYVVYDPYNEYKSIYAEIMKAGKEEVVYLSKTDTHMVIDNLVPDTDYIVNFVYTTLDSDSGELVRNTFDRLDLRTKKPSYSVEIYKISSVNNTLTYKVNLQSGYAISSVKVNLSFDYYKTMAETGEVIKARASIDNDLSISSLGKYVMGTFDISGYDIDKNTQLKLTVVSVSNGGSSIDIGSSCSFKFGR